MTPRRAAAAVVHEVLGRGRSLAAAAESTLPRVAAGRDRALARELCYGSIRFWPRLRPALERLLEHPLRHRDADVEATLLVGLYQIAYTRVPVHAAVAETVAATPSGKRWARGLANAVLRRFALERDAVLAGVDRDDAAACAHPRWLLDALRAAWPRDWRGIVDANNRRPPMTLRVDVRRTTRDAYRSRLRAAGLDATTVAHAPSALVLEDPVDVDALPGFGDGLVSVQDAAAQLAAPLLAPRSGERVLDACAAPGGKTGHLLEIAPHAEVLALDRDPQRLARVRETLARLGLEATCVAGDATDPESWWDGCAFERILIDAPCSATGIVRRQPDVKVHRRSADVTSLARLQQRLIESLWPLLARPGRLLYATCSVLPVENASPVARASAACPGARSAGPDGDWGRPAAPGRQILPGEQGMDGFYYAVLEKP